MQRWGSREEKPPGGSSGTRSAERVRGKLQIWRGGVRAGRGCIFAKCELSKLKWLLCSLTALFSGLRSEPGAGEGAELGVRKDPIVSPTLLAPRGARGGGDPDPDPPVSAHKKPANVPRHFAFGKFCNEVAQRPGPRAPGVPRAVHAPGPPSYLRSRRAARLVHGSVREEAAPARPAPPGPGCWCAHNAAAAAAAAAAPSSARPAQAGGAGALGARRGGRPVLAPTPGPHRPPPPLPPPSRPPRGRRCPPPPCPPPGRPRRAARELRASASAPPASAPHTKPAGPRARRCRRPASPGSAAHPPPKLSRAAPCPSRAPGARPPAPFCPPPLLQPLRKVIFTLGKKFGEPPVSGTQGVNGNSSTPTTHPQKVRLIFWINFVEPALWKNRKAPWRYFYCPCPPSKITQCHLKIKVWRAGLCQTRGVKRTLSRPPIRLVLKINVRGAAL